MTELRARIEAHLREAVGPWVAVDSVAPLGGGACQELFAVSARLERDTHEPAALVLRSDAPSALWGSIGRDVEARLIEVARAAGVQTPPALWLARDLVRPGAWAYFMPRLEGETLGRRIVHEPRFEAARARLLEPLAEQLGRIHSVAPREGLLPEPGVSDSNHDPPRAALERLRQRLDALPQPRPALELALRWLEARAPTDSETVLCHGDFRMGNFVVGEQGLVAVLDWEFAHWGAPAEDLAWICMRDWRFGRLDRACAGIARRADWYAAYARATGRRVDPDEVRWWEVASNVAWAAGCVEQGERYLSGRSADIELLAIARRACEMEWEALRLIGRAGGFARA
ncbi:MAG: phosphotransferase family protein [Myxococcota bacterium]|nr:phosphotransferase family protein [Myxococcota bacterium]